MNQVALGGPLEGFVGVPYDFSAAVSLLTTTLPVDYLWQVTDQAALTVTNGLNETQTFTWNSPGVKNVTVQAANAAGSATDDHSIQIGWRTIYLPIGLRNH